MRVDLPGMDHEDVAIEVDRGVLTLSGERRFEHEQERRGARRIERGAGAFRRSLTLPEGVDADAITASFDRGVLEVRVPKPERPAPRRVEIDPSGRRELETAAA